AIFNSERYGSFSYTIPNLTAGNAQTVTLYLAETYLTASGQRTFNVSINGTTVLSNFDIYASAGGQNKAIAKSFSTTANSSGQVVIQFSSVTQSPKVNGIIVAAGTAKLAEQEQSQQVIPAGYALEQNYPNPFNPTTIITFGIPENAFVSLKVYNSLGIEIAELAGRAYSAGRHSVTFDATNRASGVYFYTIRAGRYTTTQKMILQK
ncbi:MAG: malectin domain-containing carbohydrate-binding protein, partial [Bacteroidota bacterium]